MSVLTGWRVLGCQMSTMTYNPLRQTLSPTTEQMITDCTVFLQCCSAKKNEYGSPISQISVTTYSNNLNIRYYLVKLVLLSPVLWYAFVTVKSPDQWEPLDYNMIKIKRFQSVDNVDNMLALISAEIVSVSFFLRPSAQSVFILSAVWRPLQSGKKRCARIEAPTWRAMAFSSFPGDETIKSIKIELVGTRLWSFAYL